jgi:DNA/RNA-binding domain of Phe-tRNA-synthetase-like protein
VVSLASAEVAGWCTLPAATRHTGSMTTSTGRPARPGSGLPAWLAAAQVAEEVRALRPDYAALLITADGLQPGPSDEASEAILAAAEQRAARHLAGSRPEDLPQVAQWREAFRGFGAKPQRTRPSVEALLRRLDAGLPRIDRITDVYNAVSIAFLLPVGGEDLAHYAGPARLVRASGDEDFDTLADGQPVVEHPEPAEVIWRDDRGVTCRRWNWRQCARTRITATTTTALFILDGLTALGTAGLQSAAAELTGSLARLSPRARFASRLMGPDGT